MLNKINLIILFTILGNTLAHCQQYTEYEVKLVYLYQSAKHINWPSEKTTQNSEFTIGIYGNSNLIHLASKMFQKRKLNGKTCKTININSIDEASNCDLIYMVDIEKYEAIKLIKALKNKPILTIGDNLEGFCTHGGMMNFTSKDDSKRLELCPDNIKSCNLQISSQLYAICRVIQPTEDQF